MFIHRLLLALIFPSLLVASEIKQGRDGNAVAYPGGIFSNWTTKQGSDGRLIAYPGGIFSNWATSEGKDGRLIAYPRNAVVKQGNNGRLVAYYFYTDNSMKDVRQLIVDEIKKEEGLNLDALWILKTMGHLDEDYASTNSSYSDGYQEGYSQGESKTTEATIEGVLLLIDLQLQAHNLSLPTLEEDLNRTKLDFFKGGYDAASEELISKVKSNPSAYDLYSSEDLNVSIRKARSEGFEEGKLLGKKEVETLVASNPNAYNLVSKLSYEQALLDINASADQAIANAKVSSKEKGVELVKANPSTYGLYSSEDMNASIANAKSEGETSVTSNPSAYNLVTKSSYDQALLDANATAEQAIAEAKVSAKAEGDKARLARAMAEQARDYAKVSAKAEGIDEGKIIGETSVTSNPSAYNLVTQSAYDEMMNELMSVSDADTTPYSEGWFYLPNQGWLWTNRTSYPYFFDSTSKAWMYFQSGNEKPKFYHYGTNKWMTVE